MSGLFLAIGVWVLRLGLNGSTASGPLSHDDAIFAIFFGSLFCWGGFQSLVLVTFGEELPNIGHAVLLSVFLLLLGTPFIYFGIVTPEKIQGSLTLAGFEIQTSEKWNARVGALVFILAGSLCVAAVPFVWRHFITKGLLNRRVEKASTRQML